MSIDIVNKDIKKCRQEIEDFQDKINQLYEERMKKYFKLREIMEDPTNHSESLICNALLPNKKKEYQRALDDYKNFHETFKTDVEKYIKKIDDKFETMADLKKNLFDIEKLSEAKEIQAFEFNRRRNLEKIIGYIKDKNLNVAAIKRVEEIIQEKTNE
jgi:chromosome segregation ATPase